MGGVLSLVDAAVLAIAGPVAVYIFLSGVDDLFVDLLWFAQKLRRKRDPPLEPPPPDLPQASIAIVIPAWQESAVIQQMLEHNAASLRYDAYDFFVGVYPNDPLTLAAVERAAHKLPNVHWAMVPHPGPTSKGDCLNWIYQNLLVHEQESGRRFHAVLMHDAEDMIHPESLRYINHYSRTYGFIQVPVLALETPLSNLTHGLYCDEFAENQTRDLPVRQATGAFLPSAGVGTAITRDALDALAIRNDNRVFEPDSLTEDYEMGLRLHECGCRQMFLPIQTCDESFVATREYFPKDWHTAVRQRTRWITGISLQTWQRHGWKGGWIHKYWFWRDRKGLIGSPVSMIASVLFTYGLFTGLEMHGTLLSRLLPWTISMALWRTAFRTATTARVYGPALAYLAPLRMIWGNGINGVATLRAMHRFARAAWKREKLAWLKTEHQYPSRESLVVQRRRLGDLLVQSGATTRAEVESAAAAASAEGMRLGEWMVREGLLAEDRVYAALSLQQQIPVADIRAEEVPARVCRSLPATLMRERRVLPFHVGAEGLEVCGPEAPDPETVQALAAFTRLEVKYYLVPPSRFEALRARLLGV